MDYVAVFNYTQEHFYKSILNNEYYNIIMLLRFKNVYLEKNRHLIIHYRQVISNVFTSYHLIYNIN